MNIDTVTPALHNAVTPREGPLPDRQVLRRPSSTDLSWRRGTATPTTSEVEQPSSKLLRDAVREAGLFQRSVLGHLDHKGWLDRVQADGQRLIDLLAEIGFVPSEEGPLKQNR